MATSLISPGVLVTYTDDTAYASGTSSSVPLFIIGTHKNKTTPSGSTATGTLVDNANVLQNVTSQAQLVSLFGTPVFYSNDGTPTNGYELNEYGLHAAYQFMATNNQCYVLNSLIDYAQLAPLAASPRASAIGGTYWLDLTNTKFGIFEGNGIANKVTGWKSISPTIINDDNSNCYTIMGRTGVADNTSSINTTAGTLSINGTSIPIAANSSISAIANDISSANISNVSAQAVYVNKMYYIYIIQTTTASELVVNFEGTTISLAQSLGLFAADTARPYSAMIHPLNSIGSNGDYAVITTNNSNIVYEKITSVADNDPNSSTASTIWYVVGSDLWKIAVKNDSSFYCGNYNSIPLAGAPNDVWISTVTKANGVNFSIKVFNATTGTWVSNQVTYYTEVSDLPSSSTTGTIAVICGSISGIASYTPYIYTAGSWSELSYQAGTTTPTSDPATGTYWFNNTQYIADIMINSNGQNWVGYKNYTGNEETDPSGVIIAGSAPTTQSDGTPLVDNDLWLDSSDQENYPVINRYSSSTKSWTQIDNTDDYSPNGIIFKDARQDNGSGSTLATALVSSNNLDPDAPNPESYPDGLLLFNTRISTNVVKEWQENWFNVGGYQDIDYTTQSYTIGTTTYPKLSSASRWVNASGNSEDGSPLMGRKAQRSIVVASLKSAVASNTDILAEENYFTLVAAPGYIELIPSMLNLSTNKKSTVFVVGDTPCRLASDATSINAFANPSSSTLADSESAIVTSSSLVGVYYPWALSTNTDGSTVMVPPSTVALRTISYSDSISYPWKAPAGFTRGLVSNASSVGYLDTKTGNFKSVVLNNGQRDVLYENNINPIAYMKGQGLVLYGQKTRQGTATVLDRINAQRYVCSLVYQLEALAKPFLFENNTEHLRASVTSTFTRFMSNYVTLEAVYDFIVVCDDTNNTSTTIDAHELWIDIAIQIVETIEFIYIPLRLVPTGTNMSSIYATSSTTNS